MTRSFDGRTNSPVLSGQRKYLTPSILPSCLPTSFTLFSTSFCLSSADGVELDASGRAIHAPDPLCSLPRVMTCTPAQTPRAKCTRPTKSTSYNRHHRGAGQRKMDGARVIMPSAVCSQREQGEVRQSSRRKQYVWCTHHHYRQAFRRFHMSNLANLDVQAVSRASFAVAWDCLMGLCGQSVLQ